MGCEACGNTRFHSHQITGDTWVDVCSACQRSLRRHLREHKELLVRQQMLGAKVRQSHYPSSTGMSEDNEELYNDWLDTLETMDRVVEEWLADQKEDEG